MYACSLISPTPVCDMYNGGPRKPKEGIGLYGAGVWSGCEQHNMVLGTELGALEEQYFCNCWAICPVSVIYFWNVQVHERWE